jgi:hypothetical protein
LSALGTVDVNCNNALGLLAADDEVALPTAASWALTPVGSVVCGGSVNADNLEAAADPLA